MAETCATAATNEALASLRSASDHNAKDIHKILTVQEIHTCILNEMTQQLVSLLQRLGASDQGGLPYSSTIGENRNASSSVMSLSHPMRTEFLRFSGEEPVNWVYKANKYFKYYNTPVGEKLMLASFHMEREALIWFQDSEEAGVLTNWESLVRALHIRFGFIAYDDPKETLTRLRQIASVAMHKAQFEILSNRIKGLSSSHKLSCFLSGLKDEIRLL